MFVEGGRLCHGTMAQWPVQAWVDLQPHNLASNHHGTVHRTDQNGVMSPDDDDESMRGQACPEVSQVSCQGGEASGGCQLFVGSLLMPTPFDLSTDGEGAFLRSSHVPHPLRAALPNVFGTLYMCPPSLT